MWKSLRIFGIAVAAIVVTLGILSLAEVVAIEPLVLWFLSLIPLIILILYMVQRRRRDRSNESESSREIS